MFDDKLEHYNQYRPNYPLNLIHYLKKIGILKQSDLIAELGCGTGKFTDLLLQNGNVVHGVEPNREMYAYLKRKYAYSPRLILYQSKAENSFLPEKYFDLVSSAQSFHLFEPSKAKTEFYRILKPNGFVLLIWYFWNMKFEISHKIRELFYQYGDKLVQPNRLNVGLETIRAIFLPNAVFHNKIDTIKQKFSKDYFLNSMLSSSYAPSSNHILYNEYQENVNMLFDKYSHDGYIEYSFNLEIFYSKICSTILN